MGENVWSWSKTAASNNTADSSIAWSEGQTAGSVNNSARSMMAAVAKMRDDQGGALTTAGTSTAYTLTTNQVLATLADGVWLAAVVDETNTGASTLAVDGLAAKAIEKWTAAGEQAIVAGDLIAGMLAIFRYKASANAAAGAWILQNPIKPGSGVTGTTDNTLVRMDGTTGILQGSGIVVNDAGTIASGLASVVATGFIRAAMYSYGAAVALADDTATSFAIDGAAAALVLISCRDGVAAGSPNGLYWWKGGTGLSLIAGGSTNILLTTGILSGTTHTDANFNISAHTDGNLYLENRMGAQRVVNVCVVAIA